jgi:hypothetical protein
LNLLTGMILSRGQARFRMAMGRIGKAAQRRRRRPSLEVSAATAQLAPIRRAKIAAVK